MQENRDHLELFEAAIQSWKKAQVVREFPGKDKWRPAEFVEEIAADIGRYREQLLKCLSDEHQLVVAYALLVLKRANDPTLKELPRELLNRHGKITILMGGFSDKMELGAFARMLKKEAATKGRV